MLRTGQMLLANCFLRHFTNGTIPVCTINLIVLGLDAKEQEAQIRKVCLLCLMNALTQLDYFMVC